MATFPDPSSGVFTGITSDTAGDVFGSGGGVLERFAPGSGLAATVSTPGAVTVAADATGRAYLLRLAGLDGVVSEFSSGFRSGDRPFATLQGTLTGLDGVVGIAESIVSPMIVTTSLPDATADQGYAQPVRAAGGIPPYTFRASGLPPGLTIDPFGNLSGTPTAAGTFTITVAATDEGVRPAAVATTVLTLRVAPPVVRSLYVTDGAHGTVSDFALAPTGNAAPLFSLGSSDGLLAPSGVAVDSSGRVLVANYDFSAVTEFPPLAGAGASPDRTIAGPDTGLLFPEGIALGLDGEIYVTNGPSQSVTVYAAGATGDAAPVRTIAGPHTGLSGPVGMTVNPAGDLWVANSAANTLTEYAPGATGDATPMATISSPAFLNGPFGLAQDEAGRLLVTNRYGNAIDRFAADANGSTLPLGAIQGPDTGLNFPYGIDVDDLGQIYVADEYASSIAVYAPDATDDAAPVATITGPGTGIADPQALAVVPPLSLQTTRLRHGSVGVLYTSKLSAALGTRPYIWRVVHGSLPRGLRLTRAGVITGVPRVPGSHRVGIRVSDASGRRMTSSHLFTLAVGCRRGRSGARCQNGPKGTTPVNVALGVGRCSRGGGCDAVLVAHGLPLRRGRAGFTLVRGRVAYARGTLVVPRHRRVTLVLAMRRHVPTGPYQLRRRARGRTTSTPLWISSYVR